MIENLSRPADLGNCFFLAVQYRVDEFLETKAITGYELPAA